MYKTLLEDSPPHFGIYVHIVEDRHRGCLRLTFQNVRIVNNLGRKKYSLFLCKRAYLLKQLLKLEIVSPFGVRHTYCPL